MTTRNLQITIFEASPDAPTRTGARGRGSHSGGGRGSDPGENYVKPPPDDPGENYVKPPPDDWDPGENYVKPPPDDPWSGSGAYGAGPPAGAPVPWISAHYLPPAEHRDAGQAGCGCGCCCDEKGRTPERPCITPGDYSGFLIVRLAKGVGPLAAETLWELADAAGLAGLRELLELPLDGEEPVPPEAEDEPADGVDEDRRGWRGRRRRRRPDGEEPPPAEPWPPEPEGVLRSCPLILLPNCGRAGTVSAIQALEDRAARTAFRPRHGLARYWRVDLRPFPNLVEEVLDRCNELAEVDLAYRELRAIDTAAVGAPVSGSTLADDQGYFDSAPVGIGARWLKERLDADENLPTLAVVDLEQGWVVLHEELRQCLGEQSQSSEKPAARPDLVVHGENREDDEAGAGDHGTAVLGQLAAAAVGELAVEGSALRFGRFWLASHYRKKQAEPTRNNPFPGTNGHVASAIVSCLVGRSGDPAPLGAGDVLLLEVQRGRLPTETDEADFDAVRLATALGVIVVEAAGNGNYDLDGCGDPQTGRTLQRGVPGFADSGAVLVGAALSDLPHDRAPFSNFGSRVDCYAWGEGVTTCGYGDLHDGGGDRERHYTNTFDGTSSAAPIIAGAAAILQCLHQLRTGGRLMPLPMRSLLSSRATGTPQGPNVGGHIGVMPDLEAIVREVLQLVPDLYVRRSPCDDGSPRGPEDEISSSPDLVVDPGGITVRMRNRGLAENGADALLFASPTATLIPPDGWSAFPGRATLGTVSVGDVPVDSKPVGGPLPPWPAPPPGWSWPAGTELGHSFLAVFDRDGGEPSRALPPGGEWFDWRRYLEFLRGPGVAWRNVHPVAEGKGASLAFFLAGTPDRTREFGLEVIQRLPAETEVKLHLPQPLAAQLHQRQPGLAIHEGTLTLPRRRGTRFGRVRLPRNLCAPALFEVTTDSGRPLEEGHSLALRQVWRGEEVGRITWYVTTSGLSP